MWFVYVCPKCLSSDLRRSRIRNGFEWMLSLLMVSCRCRLCGWRCLKFRFVATPVAIDNSHSSAKQS